MKGPSFAPCPASFPSLTLIHASPLISVLPAKDQARASESIIDPSSSSSRPCLRPALVVEVEAPRQAWLLHCLFSAPLLLGLSDLSELESDVAPHIRAKNCGQSTPWSAKVRSCILATGLRSPSRPNFGGVQAGRDVADGPLSRVTCAQPKRVQRALHEVRQTQAGNARAVPAMWRRDRRSRPGSSSTAWQRISRPRIWARRLQHLYRAIIPTL